MSEKEEEIQLIIKSPIQIFEDQIVKCTLAWTIGELKEYLSEEYPTKPDVLEQRLIYSGRLLHNHLHLRDILKEEDCADTTVHTFHLVCNFTNQKQTSSQYSGQTHAGNGGNSASSTSDNLRRRTHFPLPSPVLPSATLNSDAQAFAQMVAMQQMYTYYMNQYMQSFNGGAMPTPNGPVLPQPPAFQPNLPNTQDIPAQRLPNQRLNAQAGQVIEENDEMANRDWLDHLFFGCRFFVLFCIVYFYSSPERLMIVIVCAVIAFLYHEGWFVRRNRLTPAAGDVHVPPGNQNPPDQAEIANDNEPQLVNQDESSNENLQDGHELEAAMDGNDPPHAQQAANNNSNNQIFSVINFISAFFSSLIPEPPPPVNIN